MHLLALRTVLLATDLDSGSVAAVETAQRLATAAGAALHVVHVSLEAPTRTTRETVEEFVRRNGVTVESHRMHLLHGDAAQAIRSVADRIRADVIVLGPHRGRPGDGRRTNLGSTALAIVTDSFTPCLVTRLPLRVPLERVLVGVDRSDTARGALVVGLSWASGLRAPGAKERSAAATMLVLHVDRTAAGSADRAPVLSQEVQRIRADAGDWAEVSIEQVTLSADDPASAIADAATERGADLIVVGTRGLGIDRTGRLGSVSASLVRNSKVPVLLVPPAVWMSHAPSEATLTPA